MTPRHFGHEWAVIAIICILGIFLFPASIGSYSAVHGPVTALLALRASIKLRVAMVLAASAIFALGLRPPISDRVFHVAGLVFSLARSFPDRIPLLRC